MNYCPHTISGCNYPESECNGACMTKQSEALRLLCKFGFHKWSLREIHVTSPIQDRYNVQTSILERCECGESRFALGGGNKQTQFIIPEKFKGEKHD